MQSRLLLLFSWQALEKALGAPQKTDLVGRVRLLFKDFFGGGVL